MMRKIATAAAALLLCGTQAFAFSDTSDLSAESLNSINRLTELGIVNGYEDGTFRPHKDVTRAEAVTMLYNMIPFGDIGDVFYVSSTYSDVTQEHWAFGGVEVMSALGYIEGYPDGTFRPDETITYTEAVKMIMDILNYSFVAEENGGYPNGYMSAAGWIALSEGVELVYSAEVTREDLAVLIDNALDAPIMVISSYNTDGSAEYAPDPELTLYKLMGY